MAVAKVKKIHLIGHQSIAKDVLSFFATTECVEITPTSVVEKSLPKKEIQHNISSIEEIIAELELGLKVFQQHQPDKPVPAGKIKVKSHELETIVSEFDYKSVITDCKGWEKQIHECTEQIKKNYERIHQILPWTGLTVPIAELVDRKNLILLFGSLPEKNYVLFRNEISTKSILTEINELPLMHGSEKDKPDRYFILMYHPTINDVMSQLVKQYQVVEYKWDWVDANLIKLKVNDLVIHLQKKIAELQNCVTHIRQEIHQRTTVEAKLKILFDYYVSVKNKLSAELLLSTTKQTFYFTGWIETKQFTRWEIELRRKFSSIEIYLTDPAPDEDVPIVLNNKKLVQPFEVVTQMYGYPPYRGGIDPTPYFAPFFALFFGYCLTDAGYGIIVALISAYVLFKFKKLPLLAVRFLRILLYGGIATIFLGAITGGWFGNLVDKLPANPVINSLRAAKEFMLIDFIDPVKNSLNFLVLAWIIGIFQIGYGVLITLFHNWKQGNKLNVLFSDIPTFLIPFLLIYFIVSSFLPGFPKSFTTVTVPTIILILCFVSIAYWQWKINKDMATKIFWSIFANYSVITGNFLADTLSYSRLFALGLATGLMAMAVNEIAFLCLGIPYVGILLWLIVFIGGHTFNIIINLLGAYVHTSRLQYLEFFSKFFSPGGRPLQPFTEPRRYTTIVI